MYRIDSQTGFVRLTLALNPSFYSSLIDPAPRKLAPPPWVKSETPQNRILVSLSDDAAKRVDFDRRKKK